MKNKPMSTTRFFTGLSAICLTAAAVLTVLLSAPLALSQTTGTATMALYPDPPNAVGAQRTIKVSNSATVTFSYTPFTIDASGVLSVLPTVTVPSADIGVSTISSTIANGAVVGIFFPASEITLIKMEAVTTFTDWNLSGGGTQQGPVYLNREFDWFPATLNGGSNPTITFNEVVRGPMARTTGGLPTCGSENVFAFDTVATKRGLVDFWDENAQGAIVPLGGSPGVISTTRLPTLPAEAATTVFATNAVVYTITTACGQQITDGDLVAATPRGHCYSDAKCTTKLTNSLDTKDMCKAAGGLGWDDGTGCVKP